MNGKEAYDKIFDKLTYDQQQELGEEVLRIVYQDLKKLEKLEKVIEILDREFIFKITDVTNIVYIGCEYSKGKLTKEEYKLLKEVL